MEGRELPVGWVVAPLLGLGELIRGVTYSKNDASDSSFSGSIPVLRANNIQDRHFDTANLVHVPTSLVAQAQIVKAGDIVIATSSGSISVVGKAAQAREDLAMAFGAFCGLIRPSNEISPEYFGHFFSSAYYRTAVSDMARGVNINNLKKSHFETLIVPLPPLNEQRRIAAKLDTTLAAVDACRQRLDGVAVILKRFRQAVLAAATAGELTWEWRGERGITTDSWAQATIIEISEQVFDGPFGSNLKSEDYTSEGFRVVRLENISHLHFLEEKRTFVSSAKFALLQKHVLFEDDILFSSFVEEDVRACLLPSALSGMSINKADCFCIRVNRELCLPGFVVSVLSCRSTFQSLDGLVHGATRPRINLKQLKSLSIALPPLQEQFEILRRQEQLFTLADQLEARHHAARKVVDRLTPALLAKAFRGELEPQDPSDEPASVLLERIRAARQAEAGAGKPSRRGRPKAAVNPEPIHRHAAPVPSEPLPPDLLTELLQECGALSERALLAASELEPGRFTEQLQLELQAGKIREELEGGERVLVVGG
jgi:type I restriction enzyme S subunit